MSEFSRLIPTFDWQGVGNIDVGRQKLDQGFAAIDFVGGDSMEHLGPEGCEDLYLQWKDVDTIVALKIGQNSIDEAAAGFLAQLLETNDSILYFFLNDNPIGVPSAKAMAEVLCYNRTLVAMQLSNADIDAEGAALIARELETSNRSLLQLDLSQNQIQNDGAKAFAKALRVNDILTTLCLAVNEIGEEGSAALADGLSVNYTLCSCDLRGNAMSDKGRTRVTNLLTRNIAGLKDAVKFCNENVKEGPLRRSKLCFIGRHATGKSELINALKGRPFNDEYFPTEGNLINFC